MAYEIELMALGQDNYALLDRAASELNGIQKQFKFVLTDKAHRLGGLQFKRAEYLSTDVWAFLKEQRQTFGGNRPFIIAFVNEKLRSSGLSNLFGSHQASDGLAVVTAQDAGHYVKEITRYYCYYLVRYTLSFINPHIKSHNDAPRADCFFHQKIRKAEIIQSLNSGKICDECTKALTIPQAGHDKATKPSAAEMQALYKMLDYVRNALPQALIMNGGGVKGLAFAGALLELEKYFYFDRHVGTSAGSIAAVLLAAGYTPGELTNLLEKKNFKDFMDAKWWSIPFNLIFKKGAFPGDAAENWIADLLRNKFGGGGDIDMARLNGAVIFAAQKGRGSLMFNSIETRTEYRAAFAARCSMSIPVFFTPKSIEGIHVFDGGLRANFPLSEYLNYEQRSNFVAMYLGGANDRLKNGLVSLDFASIALGGEERKTVDKHLDKVVILDVAPIGTVDFNLSSKQKAFLFSVGKSAALAFLEKRQFDNGPTASEVAASQKGTEDLRREVKAEKRKKRLHLSVILSGLIAVALTFSVTACA